VRQRVSKGAFSAIVGLAPIEASAAGAAKDLEGKGYRVLAVAAGPPKSMKMVGLIALSDPARSDSPAS
jgi:H+-transporting ATPase